MYTKTTTRFKSLVNKIYDALKRATFQCSLEREKTETDLFNEPLKKINSITPGPKTSHIFFSHQFKHSPDVTGNRKNHYITIHIILILAKYQALRRMCKAKLYPHHQHLTRVQEGQLDNPGHQICKPFYSQITLTWARALIMIHD